MTSKNQKKILIVYAHPDPSGSSVNRAMIEAAVKLEHVTVVDLYAQYPDFKINIKAEQQLLASCDVLIFQFPLYWYSSPALLKEWQDVVLQHGVNYGDGVTTLNDKKFFCAVTAGASEQEFTDNGYTMPSLLAPFAATFSYCNLQILPHFLLYAAPNQKNAAEVAKHSTLYSELLIALSNEM